MSVLRSYADIDSPKASGVGVSERGVDAPLLHIAF
jgi:hypothetical protein